MTNLIPDRLVEWTVGFGDHPPFGHVYGWQLDPVGEHETDVTNYCDWTNISDEMRSGVTWPVVPVRMLEQSIENLDRLATTEWDTVRADTVRPGQSCAHPGDGTGGDAYRASFPGTLRDAGVHRGHPGALAQEAGARRRRGGGARSRLTARRRRGPSATVG